MAGDSQNGRIIMKKYIICLGLSLLCISNIHASAAATKSSQSSSSEILSLFPTNDNYFSASSSAVSRRPRAASETTQASASQTRPTFTPSQLNALGDAGIGKYEKAREKIIDLSQLSSNSLNKRLQLCEAGLDALEKREARTNKEEEKKKLEAKIKYGHGIKDILDHALANSLMNEVEFQPTCLEE